MAEGFLDPKQQAFLEHYTNPTSETFANAKQSAIRAGYSEKYANTITVTLPDWLADSVGRMNMVRKAERTLKKVLDHEQIDKDGKIDNALVSNQIKASSIILKGPGKAIYSERTEVTGKDGGPIATYDLSTLTDEELARLIKESESREGKEGTGKEAS